jgi:hypothetical protein
MQAVCCRCWPSLLCFRVGFSRGWRFPRHSYRRLKWWWLSLAPPCAVCVVCHMAWPEAGSVCVSRLRGSRCRIHYDLWQPLGLVRCTTGAASPRYRLPLARVTVRQKRASRQRRAAEPVLCGACGLRWLPRVLRRGLTRSSSRAHARSSSRAHVCCSWPVLGAALTETYSPQRGCDRASLAGCCRSGEGVMTGVPPQLSWRAALYHNRWWSAVRARVCKGRARPVPRGESSFGFSRGFCWSTAGVSAVPCSARAKQLFSRRPASPTAVEPSCAGRRTDRRRVSRSVCRVPPVEVFVSCPQWRSLFRAPSGGLCFVPPVEVFVSCPQWRSLFRASRRGLCSPPKRSLSAPPKRTFPCLRGGLCFRPAGGEGLVCPCLVRGLCNALSGRAERWVPPGASPFLPRPKDPEAGAPRRYPHHLRLFFVRGVSHTKTDRDTARPAPLELGRS